MMWFRHQRWSGLIAILLLLLLSSGCAAIHTKVSKKHLDVQTKMSDSIFLEPVSPKKRVIFIQVRNTSDKPNFNIEQALKTAISAKGYRVTDDPGEAHFKLLAQILSVEKTSPTAADAALHGGYGGVLGGGISGIVIGGVAGGRRGAVIGAGAGALAGGLLSTIVNASVKDVTYMVITDIQISEKARSDVIGKRNQRVDSSQGIGGREQQTFSAVTNEKRYRTRVVSTANKANLQYEEAAAELTMGLARSLSGLF